MRLLLRRFYLTGGLQLLTLVSAVILPVATVNAATLTVTTTADSGAGSLRAALAAVNDGDTIQFDSALNGQIITLTSGELVIDKNITISGPGSSLLTVARSSGTFRIFHLLPGHTSTIAGLTIRNGGGHLSVNGGGVLNDHSSLTIDDCVIRDGFAGKGGGVYNDGSGSSAPLAIADSTIISNAAGGYGGGIYNDATSGSASVTLTNSTVNNNGAVFGDGINPQYGYGGGIYSTGSGASVMITNSSIDNNFAGTSSGPPFPSGEGGGIFGGSSVIITSSTITNNHAGNNGGGISNFANLTITSSTVSTNSALGMHDGQNWFTRGGGIDNHGMLTIANSTLSGNAAYASGGGIYNAGPTLTIANSTLSNNTVSLNGGGVYNASGFDIANTILKAGSSGVNIHNNGGTITSHGYNLSSDSGGGFLNASGDQINTDPMLGPLQNNGGPTFTHELLAGSPAINAGDPNFTPPPFYDQRDFGYLRVYNGRIDIGSFEVQPLPTGSPTPTTTATATATATAAATIQPSPTPTVTPTPPSECSLTEGFENITSLIPNGWITQNNSQPKGTDGWFQANPYENFAAQAGSPPSCIVANFLDGSGLAIVSNWLLTPPLTLQNGAKLSFWTTTVGNSIFFPDTFPDRLQVRMSTNGTSQDVGGDASSVGDFATLLLDINPTYTTTGYPVGWTNYIVTLSGIPSPVQGRLAFRYFVEDGGPSGANSNHIGLDTVAYYCDGTIPTPTPATPTPTPSVTPTPGTLVSSVAGTILFCSKPFSGVRVNITGAVSRSDLSDGSGNYWFRFLPWAHDYTVTPAKARVTPGANGIDTTDVIAIQRHFLNILPIPPGCRLTAADVNFDTMINTVDIIAVQRFFLGLTTGIAHVGEYQFTPASRSYTGSGTNWTDQNYDAVIIGDIVAPYAAP